jgi:hypothetical protein
MDSNNPGIICNDLIAEALKKHLGKEYELVGFRFQTGTAKGDNYMGDLFSVEVDVRVGNEEIQTLHWMLKTLKPSECSS